MSRRRGEFEHRTSIFEGAFRAWSHLGGLSPEDLESKPAAELDPLTNPLQVDSRLAQQKKDSGEPVLNPDGSKRREYPYEPLPRSGLAHPYVQAILSPWLGPDADSDAIQLGLTTLRTWWQHRRKGESGSAIAALGTEKMKGVVEGYTRHFFTLAHCLIVNDKEQPPRSLHTKMKEKEKRDKKNKKRGRDDGALNTSGEFDNSSNLVSGIEADLTNTNLSPLERLHQAQQRQLQETYGGVHSTLPGSDTVPLVANMKGKCIPGKIDLPGVVEAVNHQATQLAHRGGSGAGPPVPSSTPSSAISSQYGDPATTPVVFVSENGDIQIAMTIDGITCAHCVKIVETVLRGCNGNKSPIDGLLDAAADRVLNSVLIKIDKSSNAKRIAFEAARNLAMVGYTAKPKEMSIVSQGGEKKATMDLGALSTAFEVVANTDRKDVFDWSIPCTCPDNGVLRDDCARHSQMNTRIFEAFDARERQVSEYMAGCGQRYGMECTCGPSCRCQNCCHHGDKNEGTKQELPAQDQPGASPRLQPQRSPPHLQQEQAQQPQQQRQQQQQQHPQMQHQQPHLQSLGQHMQPLGQHIQPFPIQPIPMQQPQQQNSFQGQTFRQLLTPDHQPHDLGQPSRQSLDNDMYSNLGGMSHMLGGGPSAASGIGSSHGLGNDGEMMRASRNPSIISFGGSNLRHMSITSETTFGRAMSGLSALSIDWENMDDFDINEDHSLHINNTSGQNAGGRMDGHGHGGDHNPQSHSGAGGSGGFRRSSFRRSFVSNSDQDNPHVSFKV